MSNHLAPTPEPTVPGDPQAEAATRWFMLLHHIIERAGWPVVLVALVLSDTGAALVGIVVKLLEAGIWHFWTFVVLVAIMALVVALTNRQSRTIREQAERIRDLIASNETVIERSRELEDRVERLERDNG